MDFNITLAVTQEELEEFPDLDETTGIVVPEYCQDSLQTPLITPEDNPKEEAVKEGGTTVTTDTFAQRNQSPFSDRNSREPRSRLNCTVDDPCRNREG